MNSHALFLIYAIGIIGSGCAEDSPPMPTQSSTPPTTVPIAVADPDLNSYLNQDLRNAASERTRTLTEFLDAQDAISRDERRVSLGPLRPWFVWVLHTGFSNTHFAVFEGRSLRMIPDDSGATVHLFDSAQKYLYSNEFSVGWRMELDTTNLILEPSVGQEIIEVLVKPTRERQKVPGRELFGFIGMRLALIRLETSADEIYRNIYLYPNLTIGPPVPNRSASQCEASLKSDNPVEVLETLAWLNGTHLDISKAMPQFVQEVEHESDYDASLFAAVWQRPGVQTALDELAQSKIEWIRQAAVLAKIKHLALI
jgi:hypothetical protein